MLKEVYVLDNGVNIFHYSNDKNVDETHYILSSGFLGAIQSFTEETRSSKIDFFASQDEFFIFDHLGDSDKEIVCIFENSIRHTIGRMVMKHVMNVVLQSPIMEIRGGMIISEGENEQLTDNIEKIANSLISIEYQVENARQIFESSDEITLLLIYDYRRKTVHYQDNDSIDVDDEELYLSLRSLQRYMMKLFKSIYLGTNYRFIVIEGDREVVVISKHSTNLTVCYSRNPDDKEFVFKVPFEIMNFTNFEDYKINSERLDKASQWVFVNEQELIATQGQNPYIGTEDAISDGISAIERVLDVLGIEQYHNITFYPDDEHARIMKIIKRFTLDEVIVEIYE